MRTTLLFLLVLTLAASGATLYVPSGSYATIQAAVNAATAGDTVLVSQGTYDELVATAVDGSAGGYIVIKANPTNTSPTLVRGFRLKNRFNWVGGFSAIKTVSDNANASWVYIDPPGASNDGSSCVVSNNIIQNMPLFLSSNCTFSGSTVVTSDGDFRTSGLKAGDVCYFGGNSLAWYTNIGTVHTVQSISGDGLTLTVADSFAADSGHYFVWIAPGSDNSFSKGVRAPLGSVIGATNLSIIGNTFSNLVGPAITISGSNGVIRGNLFAWNHGQYSIQNQCSFSLVESNLAIHNRNIFFFTPAELASEGLHPPGGNFYDGQCNETASFDNNVVGIVDRYNWRQDCDNQLMMIQSPDSGGNNSWGATVHHDVFVGMLQHGSFSRSDTSISNVTFYRNSIGVDENVTLGGVFGVTRSGTPYTATNDIISHNAFINNGEHANTNNESPYSLSADTTLSINATAATNYAVLAETMGWQGVPATTGILTNYGDPLLVNSRDPLGPDGLPFTADDGLRPLPNSPLARFGIGALDPLPFIAQTPYAHFTIVLPVWGWQDATGTAYDTAWAARPASERGAPIRPWGTPELIGTAPAFASFNASGSIGGIYTNYVGTFWYAWYFSDGTTALTPRPYVSHYFTIPGTNWVTLWVTNIYGNTAVSSNAYRVAAGTSVKYVTKAGNDSTGNGSLATPWLTINHAIGAISAGQTISVGPGNFAETVDCNVAATTGSRITLVGHGTQVDQFDCRNPNWTFEGFEGGYPNTPVYNGVFYIHEGAVSNIWAFNNFVHNITNKSAFYFNQTANSPDNPASYCVISNNLMRKIHNPSFDLHGRGHRIMANIVRDTESEGDMFRLFGADHIISYNLGTNISAFGGGGHADFFQTFGDSLSSQFEGLTNVILECNTVLGNDCQICQLEWDQNATGPYTAQYTNIIIRNNIFANVQYAANVDLSGTFWYNNLFYHVNTGNSAHVFAFGGTKGAAFGTRMRNNVFVGCGNGTSNGWYPNTNDTVFPNNNWSLDADYDFACTTTFTAYGSGWGQEAREAHGINGGNPQFLSAAVNNFYPDTNSVLIAVGVSVSGNTVDNQGMAWNASQDMGPLAFVGGQSAPETNPPTTGTGSVTTLKVGTLRISHP